MPNREQVPTNYEDRAGFDLYKKFRGPINPYTLYNNQDRFLNMAYRFQTTGGFKTQWLANHPENATGYLRDNGIYEHTTNTMSQYYWMQMGWLGLGYSLVTNMGTIAGSKNISNDRERRRLSDDEYIIGTLRSAINMVDETFLYAGNVYRYKYNQEAGLLPNVNNAQHLHLAANEVDVDARRLTRAFASVIGSTVFTLNALIGVGMTITKLVKIADEDESAMSEKSRKALAAQYESTAISLGALSFNTAANAAKAVNAHYSSLALIRGLDQFQEAVVEIAHGDFTNQAHIAGYADRMAVAAAAARRAEAIRAGKLRTFAALRAEDVLSHELNARRAGYTGSILAMFNGILNITSLLPILVNDPNLSDRDKEMLVGEMALQAGSGLLQAGSNFLLARRLSSALSGTAGIGYPAFGIFFAGVLGSLSVLEIYGLVKQSEYANALEELGETTMQYGYFGDTLLSDLYREKTLQEKKILIGTTLLSTVGTAVELMSLYLGIAGTFPMVIAGACAVISLVVKGIQQSLIEDIANDYYRKIQAEGGSYRYFSSNMSATFMQYFSSPEMQAYLKNLQSDYEVDSVVGISTTKIAIQALELAAYTRYAAQLRTAETQVARFTAGELAIDDTIVLSDELGLIDLRGAKASATKHKQLIKFLSPLMAPGSETRTRVSTGKNSYYTTLDIAIKGDGWKIEDGDRDSIFDVQNVITRLSNNENKTILNVVLQIDGGAGDDTVFAGVGQTDYDGEDGFDTISYRGIAGLEVGLVVKADHLSLTDGEFTVQKRSSLAPVYEESTAVQGYSFGKRAETVEYREIRVKHVAFSETDQLHNMENIFGSIGNDDFTGNAAINYFHGEDGNDILRGMGGADVLVGGSGTDTLDGGAGADTADYSDAFERVAGIVAQLETPYQPAYLQYVDGLPAIYGTVEEQWLPAGASRPVVAIDKLISIENLVGTKFSDTVSGSAADNFLSGGAGNDHLDGKSGNDTLLGGGNKDGLDGNDVLIGGEGNDELLGGNGDDSLAGGEGDDGFSQRKAAPDPAVPVVANGESTGNDSIDGGDGNDTLDYSAFTAQGKGITADLQTNTVQKDWDPTQGRYGNLDTVANIENVIGTQSHDILLGNADANILAGDDGNDLLVGRDGNDTLAGGLGSDTLHGGAGIDRADFGKAAGEDGSGIFVALSEDNAVAAIATFGHIAPGGEFVADPTGRYASLVEIEAVMGTASTDRIRGNSASNALYGNEGDDRLEGQAGDDTLFGGAGQDDIDGGDGDDTVEQDIDTANDLLDGGEGEDILRYYSTPLAAVRKGLPEGVGVTVDLKAGRVNKFPGSTVAGATGIDVIRNFERVIGTNMADQISGDAHDNALFGGAGNDLLAGDDGGDFIYGGGGDDTAIGGSGNDEMTGGEGMDLVDGGDGDDLIYQEIDARYDEIDLKNDTLKGGAGRDCVNYSKILFNASQRAILQERGLDADLALGQIKKFQALATAPAGPVDVVEAIEDVVGSVLNDTLRGDALDNALTGGLGDDLLEGRDGDDYLMGDAGRDTLTGGAGNDTLYGGGGDDVLTGDDGFNVLSGGAGNDTISGGSQDDTIFQHLFRESDAIDGGAGADTLDYSVTTFDPASPGISINVNLQNQQVEKFDAGQRVGRDSVTNIENVMGNIYNDTLAGDAQDNLLAGREGNDTLSGLAGHDVLSGDEGNDLIAGGDGDDILAGGAGNDTIDGGRGADTYTLIVKGGVDVITDNAAEAGVTDTLQYNDGIAATDLWFRRVGNNLDILVLGSNDKVTVTNWFVGSAWQIESIRLGDDYGITNAQVAALVAVMAPYATIPASGAALPADVLAAIRTTWGLSPDEDAPRVLTGTAADDTLIAGPGGYLLQGLAGGDTLWGGDGMDTLDGGDGDDAMVQLNGYDNDLFNGGAGADLIDYSKADGGRIRAVLADGKIYKLDGSTVIGTDTVISIEDVFGLGDNDELFGDGANNALSGAGGHDSLSGAAGRDTLAGGSGNDTLSGGADADLLTGGSGDDLLLQTILQDQDTMDGGTGTDTLDYSGLVLAANGVGGIGADLLAGVVGKWQNGAVVARDLVTNVERLIATGFNDTITGGTGAESIAAGAGNDQFLQILSRSRDTLNGGAGNDTVDYSSFAVEQRGWLGNAGINANLASGRIDKYEVGSADAFDTVSGIENVVGSRLDDTLTGDQLANILQGHAGNDTLRASGGNDTLGGGEGLDTADYAAAAGPIVANLAQSRVLKTAAGNTVDTLVAIENVTGSGFDDSLAGDADNNVLGGGAGNDTLQGGAGNDSLAGGAGDDSLIQDLASLSNPLDAAVPASDTLDGGAGSDTVDYSLLYAGAAPGNATQASGIVADLSRNRIDKFADGVLVGMDQVANIENLVGSERNDTLTGDDKANRMSGGAGDDRMLQLFVDDSDSLGGGDGSDTIDYRSLQTPVGTIVTVVAELEAGEVRKYRAGVLAGTDHVAGIEQLIGYRFNDSLNGGLAGDGLSGFDGDDTLSGKAGNDTLAGGKGADQLQGGDGDDLIVQDEFAGDDVMDGGSGTDRIDYGKAAQAGVRIVVNATDGKVAKYSGATLLGIDTLTNIEIIVGTAFDDAFSGRAGADNAAGGAGNDSFKGSAGNDSLDGGAGTDTLDYSTAGITGGLDASLADGRVAKTISSGVTATDVVSDIEVVIGTAAADQFILKSGAETIDGGAEVDAVDYSRIGLPGSPVPAPGAAGIQADLQSGVVTLFEGTQSGKLLNIEKITGSSLDDTLAASGTTRYLAGAGGKDILVAAFRADAQALVYDGGDGLDVLDFSKMALAAGETYKVRVDLSTGRVDRSGSKNGANWAFALDTVTAVEHIVGSRFNDTLIGSANDDTLAGADGNDSLSGGAGGDLLYGGMGSDTIDGGSDKDTLDYRALPAEISLRATLANGIVRKFDGSRAAGQDQVSNVEIFIGSRQGDLLTGSAGSEMVNGAEGADSINGSAGNDTLDGGADIDTLDYSSADRAGVRVDLVVGTVAKFANWSSVAGASGTDLVSGFENVLGSSLDDLVLGNASANALDGRAGDDALQGGLGDDTLSGGAGADQLAGEAGDDRLLQTGIDDRDTFDGGAGFDVIDYGSIAEGSIFASIDHGTVFKFRNGQLAGNDVMREVEAVIGSRLNDTLGGGDNADSLSGGEGNDLLTGSRGNDSFDGGAGIDILDYSLGLAGAIRADLSGPVGRVDKFKTGMIDGSDQVAAIEILIAGAFADTITGGSGTETIKAGQGDDLIRQTLAGSHDELDGGDGLDTVDYSLSEAAAAGPDGLGRAGIVANLSSGRIERYAAGAADAFDTVSGIENVTGSRFNDVLSGDANANVLSGGLGDDSLKTSAGNDTLDGGAGIDSADYSGHANGGVIVDLNTATAEKYQSGQLVSRDELRNIERIVGSSAADRIKGGAGDVSLSGGDGNDTLAGGAGNDTLDSGGGADLLDGAAGADTVNYLGVAGGVEVNLAAGSVKKYATESNRSTYSLDSLSNIEHVSGSAKKDEINGDLQANHLAGNGGADTLAGNAGDDTLNGGEGADKVNGDEGDDLLQQTAFAGNDTLEGGSGHDLVDYGAAAGSAASDVLTISVDMASSRIVKRVNGVQAGVDSLDGIEAVAGTVNDDLFIGSDAAQSLSGAKGNDSFRGSAGNDTLDGGDGTDTLDYSTLPLAAGASSGGLRADLMAQTVDKLAGGAVVGSDTVRNVEHLNGTSFADAITGNAAENSLTGGAGNDTLRGSAGNDTLDGGTGADTVDYSAMTVTAGTRASLSVNLATNSVQKMENAIVVGTDTLQNIDSVTGSRFDDVFTGSASSDSLAGDAGNDTLTGSAGNDSFNGGAGNDVLDYSALPVASNIIGGLRASLAGGSVAKLENGVIVGTDALTDTENLIGTSFDDILGGSAAANLLRGGAGNDSFEASEASDTLDGGAGTDAADYSKLQSAAGGIRADLTLGRVDKLAANGTVLGTDTVLNMETLTGSGNADLMAGSASADQLQGGDGNDTLRGLAGDDTLAGGAGADLVEGGAGNDLLVQTDIAAEDMLDGGDGFDTLDYSKVVVAGSGILTLKADFATAKIEKFLNGLAIVGNDYIMGVEGFIGSANNDTISGGAGNTLLNGGKGDDLLLQDAFAGFDTFEGGDGVDTLDFSGLGTGSIRIDLAAGKVHKYEGDLLVGIDTVKEIEQIMASTGDDTISSSAEGTRMLGLAGNDILIGGAGIDALDGGAGNDTLNGGAGGDQLFGQAGDDLIAQTSMWGNDKLDGGDGIDTVSYSAAATADGGITLDLATGLVLKWQGTREIGSDTLSGIENVIGTWADDSIAGDAKDNLLDGEEGNDTLVGSSGNDTVDGGSGRDIVDYSSAARYINADLRLGTVVKILSSAGDETDRLRNIESLIGSRFNDILTGDSAANFLAGGDGDDRLAGGDEDDTLSGGYGNDIMDGGAGTDMLSYADAVGGVTVNLATGSVLKFETETKLANFKTDTISKVENVEGSARKDKLSGDAGANLLLGKAGNDTLSGAAGNDTLSGGSGADSVSAGEGNDLFVQDEFTGNDKLEGDSGFDTIDYSSMEKLAPYDEIRVEVDLATGKIKKQLKTFRSSDPAKEASYVPVFVEVGVDTVSGIEKIIATNFGDVLAGGANADVLAGLDGDDVIFGSLGSDTLDGGNGSDILDYSKATTRIKADLVAGSIQKFTGAGATAAGTDTVSSIEVLIGSRYGDALSGQAKDDLLSGGDGNDTISSAEGNDRLDGGNGNDSLQGGAGDDIVTQTLWNTTADTIDGGDGIDSVIYKDLPSSDTTYQIEADLSLNQVRKRYRFNNAILYMLNDTLTSIENFVAGSGNDAIIGDAAANKLSGDAGNDTLTGGAGNDTLDGGADSDRVSGGDGDDLLVQVNMSGSDNFDGGSGADTLDYSKVPLSAAAAKSGLVADLVTNRVTKTISDHLLGTDIISNIESLIGSSFNDSFAGSAAGNVLSGYHGDDTINGAGGNDILAGGNGNDRFLQFDLEGSDTIDGGNDVDTVDYSGLSTGARITGGITASLKDGKVEKRNGGVIIIDLLANVENIIGTQVDDVIAGDAAANLLSGGAGDDRLEGGAGNDRLEGGAGDDSFLQDVGSDHDTIEGGEGIDTLDYSGLLATNTVDQILWDAAGKQVHKMRDGDTVGIDSVTGIEHIVGITGQVSVVATAAAVARVAVTRVGTPGDDTLRGDIGADTLHGAAGNDTLSGGQYADTLFGDEDDDTFLQDAWLSGYSAYEKPYSKADDDAYARDPGYWTAIFGDAIDGGSGSDTLDYSQGELHGIRSQHIVLSTGFTWQFDVADFNTSAFFKARESFRNIENILGSAVADKIEGDALANRLVGNGGNDALYGNDGNDTLQGGAGIDFLGGGNGDDLLVQDALISGDTIDGGAGTDMLNYSLGASGASDAGDDGGVGVEVQLQDGVAMQAIKTSAGAVAKDELRNIENITGSVFADRISGNAGANLLDGGQGADFVDGAAGDDRIVQADWVANDTLIGGRGVDILDYGSDAATGGIVAHLYIGRVEKSASQGQPGLDQASGFEVVLGTRYSDRINGSGTDERLAGAAGDDVLNGELGDDTLEGGVGNDVIGGGAGNDTLRGDEGVNIVNGEEGDDRFVQLVFNSEDRLDGGSGIDTVDYSLLHSPLFEDRGMGGIIGATPGMFGIRANLLAQSVTKLRSGQATTDSVRAIENLIGSSYADLIIGDAAANRFNGGGGADTVAGGDGDDTLIQDQFADGDILDGGDGADTLDYRGLQNAGAPITGIRANLLTRTVEKLTAGQTVTDTITSIEHIIGSDFNDSITGDEQSNILNGGAGADSLAGELGDDFFIQDVFVGADTIDGGLGSNTVDYSRLRAGQGVSAGIRASLISGKVEKIIAGVTTSDAIRNIQILIGSDYDDTLTGDSNANTLVGGAGADRVDGLAGNDKIVQANWRDSDTLLGGTGLDTLDYGALAGGIIADLFGGRVSKKNGEVIFGLDTVSGFETIVGTGLDDEITGGYLADELLRGGAGNDRFFQRFLNGVDTLDGGDGSDTADYSRLRVSGKIASIEANLTTGRIVKIVRGEVSLTEVVQNIENVTGSIADDLITGNDRDNLLQGGAGNDSLNGGAGNDRMLQDGWSERDTLDGGTGVDTLDYSSLPEPAAGITYSLRADFAAGRVDKLSNGNVIASDTISGFEIFTGSRFNDAIGGGAGTETLAGGEGNDTLIGSLGNDTLDGGAGEDTLDYHPVAQAASASLITIHADLAAGRIKKYQDGQLIGTDLISGFERVIGTDQSDIVTGSDAADAVSAGGGNDTLLASRGNDTLDGGDGVDTLDYTEMSYAGMDLWDAVITATSVRADLERQTVDKLAQGKVTGTDTFTGIEDFIGTDFNDQITGSALAESLAGGDGNDSLSGAAGADVLYGDLGDDSVDGGAGDDLLYGGGGKDTLLGGLGNDTYRFNANFGEVTIRELEGSHDVIEIADGRPEAFSAVRSGMDLKIWYTDAAANAMTIADWYSNAGFQIEEFRIGNSIFNGSDLHLMVATTPVALSQLPRTMI